MLSVLNVHFGFFCDRFILIVICAYIKIYFRPQDEFGGPVAALDILDDDHCHTQVSQQRNKTAEKQLIAATFMCLIFMVRI